MGRVLFQHVLGFGFNLQQSIKKGKKKKKGERKKKREGEKERR